MDMTKKVGTTSPTFQVVAQMALRVLREWMGRED